MFINIKISHFAIKNGGYNKEMILLTKENNNKQILCWYSICI